MDLYTFTDVQLASWVLQFNLIDCKLLRFARVKGLDLFGRELVLA